MFLSHLPLTQFPDPYVPFNSTFSPPSTCHDSSNPRFSETMYISFLTIFVYLVLLIVFVLYWSSCADTQRKDRSSCSVCILHVVYHVGSRCRLCGYLLLNGLRESVRDPEPALLKRVATPDPLGPKHCTKICCLIDLFSLLWPRA